MPAVSGPQYRFFQWARDNPKESGVKPSVSNEFIDATPADKRSEWAHKKGPHLPSSQRKD